MAFQKAVRSKRKLRAAFIGPTGSGKTYTALSVATGLSDKVALIDTEQHSAELYANVFDFEVCNLDNYSPESFTSAINQAAQAGYGVLLIDSLSHAWMGEDGILAMVDKAAKRSQGNSYAGWRDATPAHNKLVQSILAYPGHVIVTLRSKMAYELQDNGKGKKVPVKIGLQPIQRDGVEYEFDLIVDLDEDHNAIVGKTRFSEFDGFVGLKVGKAFGERVKGILDTGVDVAPAAPPPTKDTDQRTWTEFIEAGAAAVPCDVWTLADEVAETLVDKGILAAGLSDEDKFTAMDALYKVPTSRATIRAIVGACVKVVKKRVSDPSPAA